MSKTDIGMELTRKAYVDIETVGITLGGSLDKLYVENGNIKEEGIIGILKRDINSNNEIVKEEFIQLVGKECDKFLKEMEHVDEIITYNGRLRSHECSYKKCKATGKIGFDLPIISKELGIDFKKLAIRDTDLMDICHNLSTYEFNLYGGLKAVEQKFGVERKGIIRDSNCNVAVYQLLIELQCMNNLNLDNILQSWREISDRLEDENFSDNLACYIRDIFKEYNMENGRVDIYKNIYKELFDLMKEYNKEDVMNTAILEQKLIGLKKDREIIAGDTLSLCETWSLGDMCTVLYVQIVDGINSKIGFKTEEKGVVWLDNPIGANGLQHFKELNAKMKKENKKLICKLETFSDIRGLKCVETEEINEDK